MVRIKAGLNHTIRLKNKLKLLNLASSNLRVNHTIPVEKPTLDRHNWPRNFHGHSGPGLHP